MRRYFAENCPVSRFCGLCYNFSLFNPIAAYKPILSALLQTAFHNKSAPLNQSIRLSRAALFQGTLSLSKKLCEIVCFVYVSGAFW